MTKEEKNIPEDDVVIEESPEEGGGIKAASALKLKEKLKKCLAERQEYLDGWQRMKADSINLKKEEEKRRAQLADFIKEDVFTQLFPVLDSFDLAYGNKEAWESAPINWRKGVEYIHSQLLSVLKDNGIEPIDPKDIPFDPHVHTSVETIEVSEERSDGIVIEVLQKGYVMKERIIRPARVKVGKYKDKS